MPRPRDSQRSKVYAAENGSDGTKMWRADELFADLDATKEYVHKVVASSWFTKHFGIRSMRVDDGRGCRKARGGGNRLTLPRWARTPQVILHEIAHCITSYNHAAHGREFCANYLLLVRHFMGAERHDQLRESFREYKVRYRPKRASSSAGNPAALAAWRLSRHAAAAAS